MAKFKREQVVPIGNFIITTADKVTATKSGLIVPNSSTLKPVQTVLAVGEFVRDIKIGDIVEIDPKTFPVTKTDPKHDIGADIETPIIPLYEDEVGEAFLRITQINILWKISK